LGVIGIYLISGGAAAPQVPAATPVAPSSPFASQSATATPAAQPPAPPTDPLGRSNPRSMIREFIRAVDRNDFVSAARYMQLTKSQQPHAELLARYIRELMNCCFDQPLATISDADTGALDDGLPLDQERIGPLKIGDHRADIILVHVDRLDGSIWLISSMTLDQVPTLHEFITESRIEQLMPQALQKQGILGLSFAHWIVWLLSLLVPVPCFLILMWALTFVLRVSIQNSEKRSFLLELSHKIKWPVVLILSIVVHLLSLRRLGFPLQFRIISGRVGMVLLIALVTSAVRRCVTLFSDRTRLKLLRADRRHSASMLLLGERLLNVLLTIAAAFAILTVVGVDTKTALTGLGIGGIAVAFGAQKTVENLLGGILLISDRAIAVGDLCSISGRMGTIEDITLRSVRMRTVEQTLLLVPAGSLSQENIESFRSRTKMPMTVTIRLQYSATQAQISLIRDEIYKLVTEDVRMEASSARVNVTDFGQWAIELEIWAYVLTADIQKFNAIRHELLLGMAHIIETAGCRFALPSQTIYSGIENSDTGRKTTLQR
jgi:MscS family membrane protein